MARATEGFDCRGGCHPTGGRATSYEDHHVWPQQFHGPDEPWNMRRLCANAHSNTHDLLNKIVRGRPYDLKSYSPTERKLALEGWALLTAYAEEVADGRDSNRHPGAAHR